MSIIEKALDKQNDGNSPSGEDATGETVAERLEAEQLSNAGIEQYEQPEESGERIIKGSRLVHLDLERLDALGILTPERTRSHIAEDLRIIKRPLLINAFQQGGKAIENGNLIMIASDMPGEGKTFTAANLAMRIAMELDRTVLLVDADVAKPSITRLFGIEAEIGLVDVLTDDAIQLSDALIRTDVPKLTILPAGARIHHSTEVLASDAMTRLAQELSQRYSDRVVIVDSPPLLVASQATVLARLVGQIVMVVEADKTPQHVVQDALECLDTNSLIGMVLNKTGQKLGTDYYGYGYYGM